LARLAGLDVPGHGPCQVGTVQDRGGCGQKPGGGYDAAGLPVQRSAGAEGAETADMLADRGGQAGIDEVLAEGP
jgi:hypothetical protein